MPASAFAMHRRIEAVLAFNADPEGRIRRLARRAARRTAAAIAAVVASIVALLASPLAAQAAAAVAPVVVTPAIAPRIRAPPQPGELLEAIGGGGRFLRNFQQISGITRRHWKRFQSASNATCRLALPARGIENARH
jgi:hypothetical protein